jgi:glycosyltransferase involved in cell wall biosynthesis
MLPEVTIITPVLNGAATIERCIRSVAVQGVQVQHIIMDGGSTDGTVDILRANESRLAYWHSGPDGGQSHAINKGLKLAKGRIFNWLNADDTLELGALREVVDQMHDDVDVVVGTCVKMTADGKAVSRGKTSVFESTEQTLARYGMAQPSHFYRTEVIKEMGGVNENLHFTMDMDLWFRYLLKCGVDRVRSVDTILSRFYLMDDAKSQQYAAEMKAEHWGLMHGLLRSVDLPDALRNHLKRFPIPVKGDRGILPEHIDQSMLLAFLLEGMMPQAYADGDERLLRGLFTITWKAGLLDLTDVIAWQFRIERIRPRK